MRKFLSLLIMFLLCQYSTRVLADNLMYMTGPNAKPGQTVELTLNLRNTNPVAAWACALYFPEGIVFNQLNVDTNRYPKKPEAYNSLPTDDGGTMFFVSCGTSSNSCLIGTDGAIATISISVPDDYAFGDYDIELKRISLSTHDAVSLPVNETSTFTLKVVDPDASTLIFDSNGGSAIDSITQKNGSTITPPANPTREGYTFIGWEPAIPDTMPMGGLTVTAQWQINQHTATFTIPSENWTEVLTLDYGSEISAPIPPKKPGFTFDGWDKPIPETMPDADLVFTGSYTQNFLTLSLTATGNGTVRYGNTSVRSSSQSFDVAELSEVVLTVTPDFGHHVETLTINGEDALSRLTDDGKLPLTRSAAIGTWTFDNPSDLLAGTGIATLQATTHAKGIVTVTDLATAGITSVNGPDADNGAVNVPIGSSLLMAANNNATSMGSYSIMYDVSVEDGSPYIPLLQNSLTDSKDASLFIHNNAVGLGSLGYHGSIENGKWYRIVFVVEPNGASLYVDGIQVASNLNLTAAYNQHWLLTTGALFFADEDGEETAIKISELRFWDVALTADEVGMLGACGSVASSYGGMTSSVTVAVTFANNSDLNDDGLVDVSDIMTIINNIADDIYLAAADLNSDGFVDVGDIMVVINAIIGIHDNTAGVKAMRDVTNSMPATENDDYLTISNEDNIVSIQLDNEYEYSAFQMLVTLPDGVDIDDVIFNSDRLNGFTQFARKVNERQYIIIGFSMDGNVITGSAGKILSISTTGNADDNIIISNPIFSIPEAKSYKLRVDDSFTTNLQDIQAAQISVRGNTVYVHANNDTMLNIYSVSGALCERKHLHSGVNTITLRRGQYIINNRKVSISK